MRHSIPSWLDCDNSRGHKQETVIAWLNWIMILLFTVFWSFHFVKGVDGTLPRGGRSAHCLLMAYRLSTVLHLRW